MKRLSCLIAVVCCLSSHAQTKPASPYTVLHRWPIGGTGGWDYLVSDDEAHRLYIAHNTRVEVLDTARGTVLGAVTGLKGAHGIALDPDGKRGYVSDGVQNAVIIFDRSSFATIATVPAGEKTDGILYEPFTKTVWAFNGRSNSVTVINPDKKAVVTTISLPGKPEFPQADGNGSVFVNIEDKNSIVALNARTRAVNATWSLPGCESPSGMAMDRQQGRLFSVCDGNTMVVTDAAAGKQLARAAIGAGPDAAAYDPTQHLAFSSNGESGTLSVIDTQHGYKTIQTLTTQHGARTLALDAITGRIYLATARFAAPAPGAKRAGVLPDSFTILVVGR